MKQTISWKAFILFCGIILMASNLRAPIVSVGPIIPEMIAKLGLTPVLVGLVTTLPLLCFAFGSPFMPKLSDSFGLEKTLFYSIILLALGVFMRSGGNLFYLFFGSVIIGLAITIGNVLMPPFIKKSFPNKVGLMTAFYLASMNLVSALAVGYSINMGEIGHLGWKSSIGIWGFLSVIAFFAWIPILRWRKSSGNAMATKKGVNIWKSRMAWQISLFMGSQSVVFYALAAWLPTILQSWGMDAARAGWMLSYIQLGQAPVMIITPLLADKMKKQTGLVWLTFFLLLAGLILMIIWKTKFIILSSILIGVSVAIAFALATMFFVIRTKNITDAAALSGMSQSVGYFLAACFPPLFGVLYAWTDSWYLPLFTLLAATFLLLFSGIPAAKDKVIGQKEY